MSSQQALLEQRTIQNTDQGIHMMQAGNYRSAIGIFSGVLGEIKHCLVEAGEGSGESSGMSLDACMSQIDMVDDNEEESLYLYDQVIRMPADLKLDYTGAVVASAVVMFNLALAYQKSATTLNDLKKSAKLYELACNLLLRQESCMIVSTMFTLAAVNNMGLVFQQMNDAVTAKKCFEQSMSIMMLMVDHGHEHASLDGFLMNASTVNFNANPAAAA